MAPWWRARETVQLLTRSWMVAPCLPTGLPWQYGTWKGLGPFSVLRRQMGKGPGGRGFWSPLDPLRGALTR